MSANRDLAPENNASVARSYEPFKWWQTAGLLLCILLLVCGLLAAWYSIRLGQQIAELKAADVTLRRKATEELGKSGNRRAVEPLIAALSDPDSGVRGGAATALGEIKDPRALQPLLAALKLEARNNNYEIAKQEAEAMGSLGPPALGTLLAAQMDSDLEEYAGAGLVSLGSPAVDALIARMKTSDSAHRELAAVLLGEIKDPRSVDALLAVLEDSDLDLRRNALDALGEIGDPRATSPLIALLDAPLSRDPELAGKEAHLRDAAARALGRINSPEAIEYLLAALHRHNDEVIVGADEFYLRRGDPGSEDALIEALNKVGDEGTASDFLNCGNQKLHDAAEDWASRNNYEITFLPGGRTTTWGGKQ